jgi:hypothetical protein
MIPPSAVSVGVIPRRQALGRRRRRDESLRDGRTGLADSTALAEVGESVNDGLRSSYMD